MPITTGIYRLDVFPVILLMNRPLSRNARFPPTKDAPEYPVNKNNMPMPTTHIILCISAILPHSTLPTLHGRLFDPALGWQLRSRPSPWPSMSTTGISSLVDKKALVRPRRLPPPVHQRHLEIHRLRLGLGRQISVSALVHHPVHRRPDLLIPRALGLRNPRRPVARQLLLSLGCLGAGLVVVVRVVVVRVEEVQGEELGDLALALLGEEGGSGRRRGVVEFLFGVGDDFCLELGGVLLLLLAGLSLEEGVALLALAFLLGGLSGVG